MFLIYLNNVTVNWWSMVNFVCLMLICITMVTTSPEEIDLCHVITQHPRVGSSFNMNGSPLQSMAVSLKIPEQNDTDCFINITKVIDDAGFPSFPVVGTLVMACMSTTRVHFSGYTGAYLNHVIFYIQIHNCIMSVKDLNTITSVGDARVMLLIKSQLTNYNMQVNTSNIEVNHTCHGFNSLVSFNLVDVQFETKKTMVNLLDCIEKFSEMAEVIFKGISWIKLPEGLQSKYPNLQALEIPHNNLTKPPDSFPWTSKTVALPKNLSRTTGFQNHYSVSEYMVIPNNIFRRILNLDNNKIIDLSNYTFYGFLHMISVTNNGLIHIANATFNSVTGLQVLDLSSNKIISIPSDSFKGLTHLRKLDLSKNTIGSLESGIFDTLVSLVYLQLANNNLSSLGSGLFTNLQHLEVIHLEYNHLTSIYPDSFLIDTLVLKEIYLNNNPIVTLPEFIFWIRGLQLADFHSTDIRFDNLTRYIENMDRHAVLTSNVDSASDADLTDLLQRAAKLRKINLSKCNISDFYVNENTTAEVVKLLKVLLLHYEFNLKNNPLKCSCRIIPMSELIHGLVQNGTINKGEYFFTNWVCDSPTELFGKRLLTLHDDMTYCEDTIKKCPHECKCYKRPTNGNVIVDCRKLELFHIHDVLPGGSLELWYSSNNISTLKCNVNFKNMVSLDVHANRINKICPKLFNDMRKLKELHLHSNLMTYLPANIRQLKLSLVTILPNPFYCDCNSLWLKQWLIENNSAIKQWNTVTCNVNDDKGQVVIEVADKDFVCRAINEQTNQVLIPSITSAVVVVLVLAVIVMVYAFRMECKVLMFVYMGVHPFDNDRADADENIDCVIVHSGTQTDWVMSNIVEHLESENYKFVVCDVARDFVVGYSFQENLTRIVEHSKRMIFCISNDWSPNTDTFAVAWGIAQEKIKETKSHFGIIVSHGIPPSQIKDKDLRLFMKRGRYVDSSEKLFANKVVYYMPQKPTVTRTAHNQVRYRRPRSFKTCQISECFINRSYEYTNETTMSTVCENVNENTNSASIDNVCHAFVSYAYEDIDYVTQVVQPMLEDKGFRLCIPDRDFVPGASKEENILTAINNSMKTIFILSEAHVIDEWSLFTFRTAYEKSLKEKYNNLIVIIKEDVETETLDKEIRHYIKNYICLHVTDRWFERKLYNGLPLLRHAEHLRTTPLLYSTVSTEDVVIE